MKVFWVVTPNFYPIWAGPTERFFRYAKISKDLGLEFIFQTVSKSKIFERNVFEGVGVNYFKAKSLGELYLKTFISIFKKENRKPNACLFLSLHPSLIFFNFFFNIFKIKTIYVSTMDFNLSVRNNGKSRKGLRNFLFKLYFRYLINSFDKIVSSSEFLTQRYIEIGVKTKKLKTIPNGVNLNKFHPLRNNKLKIALREQINLPDREIIFLFVGLLVERKGVLNLIRAWKIYKNKGGDGILLLVGNEKRDGDSSPQFYIEFDKEKETIMDKHQIIFRPASKQINMYFNASDVFIFLSRLEGMPNVLLEAMASGLPILLNKFQGFSSSDYGEDGKNYISTTLETESIIKNIDKLIKNFILREQLAKNSRELVEKNFQVQDSIEAYGNLINNHK